MEIRHPFSLDPLVVLWDLQLPRAGLAPTAIDPTFWMLNFKIHGIFLLSVRPCHILRLIPESLPSGQHGAFGYNPPCFHLSLHPPALQASSYLSGFFFESTTSGPGPQSSSLQSWVENFKAALWKYEDAGPGSSSSPHLSLYSVSRSGYSCPSRCT